LANTKWCYRNIGNGSLELKSILVATDLTEASDKALQHGIAIARQGHITFPKPDSLENADEIGGSLSLPCKFSKPFLYEGDPVVIQDESRKYVKKPRFSEQHLCCLGQITTKL
jgi:hypothetical protein